MDTATSILDFGDNNFLDHLNEDPSSLAAQDTELAQGRSLPLFVGPPLLLIDSYKFNRTPRYPCCWLWKVAKLVSASVFCISDVLLLSMVCLAGCICYDIDVLWETNLMYLNAKATKI